METHLTCPAGGENTVVCADQVIVGNHPTGLFASSWSGVARLLPLGIRRT
jgi:hypothetical protein